MPTDTTTQNTPTNTSSMGVSTPSTINASQLGATSPFSVPPAIDSPSSNAYVSSLTAGDPMSGLAPASELQSNVDTANAKVDSTTSEIESLMKELGMQSTDTQNLQNKADLTGKANEIANLNEQLTQRSNQYNKTYLANENKPISVGAIRGQNAATQRQAAYELGALSAVISAKKGNLDLAKSTITDAINQKYQPLKDEYQRKLDFLKLNYDKLSGEQKKLSDRQALILQAKKDAIDKEAQNEKDIHTLALSAIQKGGAPGSIMSDIAGKSFEEATAILAPYLKDPSIQLDMAIKRQQLEKLKKETQLLGEPTAKEKEAAASAITNAKASVQATQDKIATVDALLTSGGLGSRVGSNFMTRTPTTFGGGVLRAVTGVGIPSLVSGGLSSATGQGQSFAGGIHRLVSGLTLDSLINAKKQGATFGALSDSELSILANSASAINDWEIKDKNGKGTGVWNIDEETFKKELKNIQDLSRRALVLSQGTALSQDEQSLLDNTFSSQVASDPASYY